MRESHDKSRQVKQGATTIDKRLKAKQLKNKGLGHFDRKGKYVSAKLMKDGCKKCIFKCHDNFSPEERKHIFQHFYDLGNIDTQNQFIGLFVESRKSEIREKNKGVRCKSNIFTLQRQDNTKHRVCSKFFLDTLGISYKKIQIVLNKKTSSGTVLKDKRGHHTPNNKASPLEIERIKSHIQSYPQYESHYSRTKTSKKYLHPDLNISKMYEAYVDKCKDEKVLPKSYHFYREIFKGENLAFKHPYNDTCGTCDRINIACKQKDLIQSKRLELEEEKAAHDAKVNAAYQEKREDKLRSRSSGGKIVVKAFDLQKVLDTPHLTTGISYYKRLLSTYNLTIHNLGTNEATCYMWCEVEGGRGSDEIASALYHDIINSCSDEVEEIIYYSDNCAGQNHNFTLPVMFLQAMEVKPNIQRVHHKFLEPGHTRMECDSDHARIEKAKPKDMAIFIPRDWFNLVRMVRSRNKPMKVVELTMKEIYSFKSLYTTSNSPYVRRLKLSNGDAVGWSKRRYIFIERSNKNIISLSTTIKNPTFVHLNIARHKSERNKSNVKLLQKNYNKLPISDPKYNDLMDLLKFVPSEFHDFYINLPHNPKLKEMHADLINSDEE